MKVEKRWVLSWILAPLVAACGSMPVMSAGVEKSGIAEQDKFVELYVIAQKATVEGLEKISEALDLKDQAALLAAEAQALESGATKGGLAHTDTLINDSQKAVQAKLAEQKTISAEAKVTFGKGLIPYVVGVGATVAMKDPAAALIKRVNNASAFEKAVLVGRTRNTMAVATGLGAHLENLLQGARLIVEFARSNGIPVPADANKLLGTPAA